MFAFADRAVLGRQSQIVRRVCLRYYNATSPLRSPEGPSKSANVDSKIHIKAPDRGPTRQERAKLIADQVSAVNQGPPPEILPNRPAPDVSPAPPRTKSKTGDAFIATPTSTGPADDAGARMGDNDPASREGPVTQGVGPITQPGENAAAETASSLSNPELPSQTREVESTTPQSTQSSPRIPRQSQSPVNPPPRKAIRTMTQTGSGTATIAGGNFTGVIRDHLAQLGRIKNRLAATPPETNPTPTPEKPSADPPNPETTLPRTPSAVRQSLVDRLVRGHITDDRGVFQTTLKTNATPHQRALASIDVLALKNITYCDNERNRILAKVQSFLDPTTTVAEAAAAASAAARKPSKARAAKEA